MTKNMTQTICEILNQYELSTFKKGVWSVWDTTPMCPVVQTPLSKLLEYKNRAHVNIILS